MGSSPTLPKSRSLELKLTSDCEKQFPAWDRFPQQHDSSLHAAAPFEKQGERGSLPKLCTKEEIPTDSWREMMVRAPVLRRPSTQEHGCTGARWWSLELNLECKFYFYMNSNLNPKMLMLPSTAWKMISPLWNLTQELWPLSSDWHSSSLWEQWRDWDVECWGRLLIACQMGPAPQWPMPCT